MRGGIRREDSLQASTSISRSVGVRSTFYSSISFLLLSCPPPSHFSYRFTSFLDLKSTFEALRREGSDFTDLQFALAGHVCATRTLNAVRVRRPGKSERLHPTGNAPPSHHSSVTLNLQSTSGFRSKYYVRTIPRTLERTNGCTQRT